MLVNKNKNLRDVKIQLLNLGKLERALFVERMTEILECFFQCPNLQHIDVNSLDSPIFKGNIAPIQQLLSTKYRYRRAIVSLFFHIYE